MDVRSLKHERFLVYSSIIDGPYRIKDLTKVISMLKLHLDDAIWLSSVSEWIVIAQVESLTKMLPPEGERRKSHRAPIEGTITVHNYKGNVFYGSLRNISPSGCMIRDLTKFDEGEKVSVIIRSPYFVRSIPISAKIVRVAPTDKKHPGLGVSFMDMSAADRNLIERYVEQVTQLAQDLIQSHLKEP